MALPFAPRPGSGSGSAARARSWRRLAAAALLPALLALPALPAAPARAAEAAQDAMLIADSIALDGRNRVVARGNVEALQGDVRLTASRVSYDQETGRLQIEGPIRLTRAGSDTVIVADAAELDPDLRDGLMTGARMMLNRQVQLAAAQLTRSQGRYATLSRATVSSCQVCGTGRPPLWQIRAARVVHDRQEHRLYFDHARFEVLGLPVLYLPRLRLPDPSQDRASGMLIPSIRRNSELGTGMKLPYFWAISDNRDLLLTPYLSQNTRTLEFRYRQAFRRGSLGIRGALSSDDLLPDETRGHIRLGGRFLLPRDLVLGFDAEAVTDDGYLNEYDYSDKDRLDSRLSLSRARRDEWVSTALTHYHSLREDEDNATLPSLIGDASYERRLFPDRLGGELRLGTELHHHYRYSDRPVDGSDPGLVTDGRDVTRLTLSADWRRWYTLPAGIRAGLTGGLFLDSFHTAQDAALPLSETGLTPQAALTLRWPLSRVTATGASQVIEPLAQIAWSGGHDLDVANDESTRLEFDEGNLLGLTRFAAPDRRERGWRAAYGVSWSHFAPSGWQNRLVLGQVWQESPAAAFSETSGLDSAFSDLLVAGQVAAPGGWSLSARGLFEDGTDPDKAEARAAWRNDRADLSASYVWLGADEHEDRPDVISEWVLDGSYRWTEAWQTSLDVRYDVADDRMAEAGMGVTWSNECVDVSVSVSKSFASSTVLSPSTDFSFMVGLRGFSAGEAGARSAATCR